jgi:hypothetical protein
MTMTGATQNPRPEDWPIGLPGRVPLPSFAQWLPAVVCHWLQVRPLSGHVRHLSTEWVGREITRVG